MQVEIAGGLHLHLTVWGTGRPRVLLIHGFGDGGFVWERFVAGLNAHVPIAAVDLRGHGDSSWDPAGRYAQRVHTNDVIQLLVALDLRDVVVVGHSLGAEIAMRVAAGAPERVNGLVLVDGGARCTPSASDRIRSDFAEQPWHYFSSDDYAEVLMRRLLFAHPDTLRQLARRALRAASPAGFALKCDPALRRFARGDDEPPIESFYPHVECATLLIRGSGSAFLPKDVAREAQESLRSCELVDVPRSGHAVMLDNPAGLAAAVGPFLSRMSESQGRAGLRLAR